MNDGYKRADEVVGQANLSEFSEGSQCAMCEEVQGDLPLIQRHDLLRWLEVISRLLGMSTVARKRSVTAKLNDAVRMHAAVRAPPIKSRAPPLIRIGGFTFKAPVPSTPRPSTMLKDVPVERYMSGILEKQKGPEFGWLASC